MAKREKLLEAAKSAPTNLSFDDLCSLAECYGFEYRRQKGSHRVYEHPALLPEQGGFMNFQSDKGKAKAYQVKQLVKAIENLTIDDEQI
jgi:hypothetical protein